MPFFYCTCALGTKGNGTYCISKLKCALFEVTFSWLRNIDALSLNNALLQLCRDVKKYLLVNTSLKIDPIHFLGPGMKVFAVLPWLKLTNSTCFFSNSPLVLSYYRTGSGLHDWLKAFNKQMAWGIPNVQLVTIPKPCAGNRTRGIFFVLFCFIWENYAIFHWMSSPVSAALLRMLTFSCCLFLGARGLSSRGVSRGAISKIELRWRWQGRGGGGKESRSVARKLCWSSDPSACLQRGGLLPGIHNITTKTANSPLQLFQVQYVYRNDPEFLRTYVVGLHNRYTNSIMYSSSGVE